MPALQKLVDEILLKMLVPQGFLPGSGVYDMTENIFNSMLFYFTVAEITWECIKMLGPASLCILPALFRGSVIVKKLFPQSAEIGWIMRATPVFFTPLIGFLLLLFVQITNSYLVMVATFLILIMFLGPAILFSSSFVQCHLHRDAIAQDLSRGSKWRTAFGSVAMLFIIIYLSVDQDAQDQIHNLDAATVLQFILEFLVKYNSLTIISADWLFSLAVALHASRAAAPAEIHASADAGIAVIASVVRGGSLSEKPLKVSTQKTYTALDNTTDSNTHNLRASSNQSEDYYAHPQSAAAFDQNYDEVVNLEDSADTNPFLMQ